VADTGTGIPADAVSQVFEPFFTTKSDGKGTGLGLSISLGIVRNHEGTIEVVSEKGKGTTFLVNLPVAR
jgi:signal transduction histidine kinase